MDKDTIEAIAILVDFFTEEEQNQLAIELNGHRISFIDQCISRGHSSVPRYKGVIFKSKAAMLISANKNILYRLIEFSKPEFQEKMKRDLYDLSNYFLKNIKKQTGGTKDIKANFNQQDSVSAQRTHMKNRGGTAESGQEFVELDKVGDQEDMLFLKDGLNKSNKISPTLDLEKAEEILKTVNDPQKPSISNSFSNVEKTSEDIEFQEGEVAIHSTNTHQARTKNINENLLQGFNISSDKFDRDLDEEQFTSSLVNAYNRFFSFKFRDLRELMFQKLDILFSDGCQ